jgi:hypothetical protein
MINPQRPAWTITSSMLTIRSRPTFKINPVSGKPVSYAQNGLKLQPEAKYYLDTNTRFDYSGMYSLFKWVLQYVGVQLMPVHNCPFSIHPLWKSNFLSFRLSASPICKILPDFIYEFQKLAQLGEYHNFFAVL